MISEMKYSPFWQMEVNQKGCLDCVSSLLYQRQLQFAIYLALPGDYTWLVFLKFWKPTRLSRQQEIAVDFTEARPM